MYINYLFIYVFRGVELTKLVKIMEGIRQPNVVIYLKLTDEFRVKPKDRLRI